MKKTLLCVLFSLFSVIAIFSQEKKSPFTYDMIVDATYHPYADYIPGGNHYSKISGPFDGMEARVIGNMNYTIPVPLGNHWLLNDTNVMLQANIEISPITIKPGIHVDFTPVPFLVFSAGAQIGSGWNLGEILGIGKYNGTDKFEAFSPFEAWLMRWYVSGTFQFDTGAVWPGDWNHFQLMYTYQMYYEALSNVRDGDIWMWQNGSNMANGLSSLQTLIVAYEMPLVLSRVGCMFEIEGHYSASDYPGYENFKGDFLMMSINPLCQFTFDDKNRITLVGTFKTRRSFAEPHERSAEEIKLTYTGYEWYFQRFVIRYEHKF